MFVLPRYHIHISELVFSPEEARLPARPFEQVPSPTPVRAPIRSTQGLDLRLGPLDITYLYLHKMDKSYTDIGAIQSRFEQVSTFEVSSNDAQHTTDQGVVHVPFGIIHLFRVLDDIHDPKHPSMAIQADDAMVDDETMGTILAMLNVPASMNASALLQFLDSALEAVEQVRIIHQSRKNYLLVLVKFRDALDAEEFFKMYNGVPFDAFDTSDACELVYITGFTASATSSTPIPYPMSSALSPWPIILPSDTEKAPLLQNLQPYRSDSGLRKNAFELPTCPVCLDRLDSRLSGIVTVLCQHSFHCACLQRWDDSRCPVCRHSYVRHVKGASSHGSDASLLVSHCGLCQNDSDLWMCLICANVGCGRYTHGHARQHYEETGHLYSLEVDTQRVWDYAGDGYVHRLIQSKSGGKLVELPSATNMAASVPGELWNSRYPSGSGRIREGDVLQEDLSMNPTDRAQVEILQEKMEALGAEYSSMIMSQLDSQRVYYEGRLAQAKSQSVSQCEYELACKERDQLRTECSILKEQLDSMSKELSSTQFTVTKQDTQLRRALETVQKTRYELEEEKSVSSGLYSHVQQLQAGQGKLQTQIADLNEQLRDMMFFVSARDKIDQMDDSNGIAGGDVIVPTEPSQQRTRHNKKKGSSRR